MIKVKDLHKVYGKGLTAVHALKGINMEVEPGEFVAIMGRSGSGKSTLLHLLGLLDTPTSGEVCIENMNISKLPEKEKVRFRLEKLGYIFQEYSLLSELTALENVYLPALSLSLAWQNNYKKRATEMLATVGLGERLKHYPNELSGGEQQRVAVARALINGPSILFADEPTASLDATSAEVILELFSRLNKDLSQTIVMVTHEPEDEKYVDRVIWLKDGLVEKESMPYEHEMR
ncbi:Bacitracin export ATP-binding protein BceA [subsurface metagenome]